MTMNNEVEEGREVFDNTAVEDTMKEVNDEFNVSDAQAKVAEVVSDEGEFPTQLSHSFLTSFCCS